MCKLKRHRDFRAVLYLLGLLASSSLLTTGIVSAQSPGATAVETKTVLPATTQEGASADALKARLKALEAQQDIPADEKAKIAELLTQAVAAAERADALKIDSERLRQEAPRASERLVEIREALAQPVPSLDVDALMATIPAADAETRLRETEGLLATARQKVNSLNDAVALLRQRPEVLQASLAEAKERLAKIVEEIKAPSVSGEAPGVVEARQSALEARQRMRNAEIGLFEQELSFPRSAPCVAYRGARACPARGRRLRVCSGRLAGGGAAPSRDGNGDQSQGGGGCRAGARGNARADTGSGRTQHRSRRGTQGAGRKGG